LPSTGPVCACIHNHCPHIRNLLGLSGSSSRSSHFAFADSKGGYGGLHLGCALYRSQPARRTVSSAVSTPFISSRYTCAACRNAAPSTRTALKSHVSKRNFHTGGMASMCFVRPTRCLTSPGLYNAKTEHQKILIIPIPSRFPRSCPISDSHAPL